MKAVRIPTDQDACIMLASYVDFRAIDVDAAKSLKRRRLVNHVTQQRLTMEDSAAILHSTLRE